VKPGEWIANVQVGDLVKVHHKIAPFDFENFLGVFIAAEKCGPRSACVRYTFITDRGIVNVIDSLRKTTNTYEVVQRGTCES
jgi:ribosomal protein L19